MSEIPDYDLADILENTECPISTEPLSPDGSTTYIKDLNVVLKLLLNKVKTEGHLAQYWLNVQKENDRMRHAAYRVKIDRERIAYGSAYNSSNDTHRSSSSEEESDWSVSNSSESDFLESRDDSMIREKENETQ